jgi:hypothetical protein
MSNLTLYQELEELVRLHSQYTFEDGVMPKNSIMETVIQLRPNLHELIPSKEKLKAYFFTEVERLFIENNHSDTKKFVKIMAHHPI